MSTNRENFNPWKAGVIGVGSAMALLIGAGAVVAALYDDTPGDELNVAEHRSAPAVSREPSAPAAAPAAAVAREDCSRYLNAARRDNTKVLKDGLVGGAIGAGLGAAGGAIADGGSGAGKGAGIGGLVGSVAGALNSNEKEREKVVAAERAYNECVARNGR